MPKSVAEQVAHSEMETAIQDVWKAKMADLGFEDWKFGEENFFEQDVAKIKAANLAKDQLRFEIAKILRGIEIPS